MPSELYQPRRSLHQYSNHSISFFSPGPVMPGGGTKYSISICSNSQERKVKCSTVISLRKLLPCCAMPNGGFMRMLVCTFKKFVNIACAVSGRRYTAVSLIASAIAFFNSSPLRFLPSSAFEIDSILSTLPSDVRNIMLKRRMSERFGLPQLGQIIPSLPTTLLRVSFLPL